MCCNNEDCESRALGAEGTESDRLVPDDDVKNMSIVEGVVITYLLYQGCLKQLFL